MAFPSESFPCAAGEGAGRRKGALFERNAAPFRPSATFPRKRGKERLDHVLPNVCPTARGRNGCTTSYGILPLPSGGRNSGGLYYRILPCAAEEGRPLNIGIAGNAPAGKRGPFHAQLQLGAITR